MRSFPTACRLLAIGSVLLTAAPALAQYGAIIR